MQSPRKLMVKLVACGLGLGILGGAQVSTAMKPGPEMPFRWADASAVRAPSMQFAASVPLELDVPDDFQLASAMIDGDPASETRALGREPRQQPRSEWAALQLSSYKVDAPDRLPDYQPEPQVEPDTAVPTMASGSEDPSGNPAPADAAVEAVETT